MHRILPLLIVITLTYLNPAWASEPGQPLDCSDWVFLEAGLTCSVYAQVGSLSDNSIFFQYGGVFHTDNTGSPIGLRFAYFPGFDGSLTRSEAMLEIVRHNGTEEEILAHIEDRLVSTLSMRDHIRPSHYYDFEIDRGTPRQVNGPFFFTK